MFPRRSLGLNPVRPHAQKFVGPIDDVPFAGSLNASRFKLPDEAVRLASGELRIAGGSKVVEVFDPHSGKFLIVSGEIEDARHFGSETRLSEGHVLLAGGSPNNDQAQPKTGSTSRKPATGGRAQN